MKRNDAEVREIDRLRARVAMMSEVSRRITNSWDLDTVLREVQKSVRQKRAPSLIRNGALGFPGPGGLTYRSTRCCRPALPRPGQAVRAV